VSSNKEKQDRLMRVGYVLACLAFADIFATFYVAGNEFVSNLLAILMLLIIAGSLLLGPALQKTGPPFEAVRWYWPWASRR
jgi:hypothetical protein